MRELAGHIIETKAADFDPSKFEDRYENAVIELIRSKQAGEPLKAPEAPRPSNVVNLMDALRRSIDAERPEPSTKKAPSKTGAERSGRKAAGKAPAKAAAKKGRSGARKAG
jgi:DNA end-binding protein Ku